MSACVFCGVTDAEDATIEETTVEVGLVPETDSAEEPEEVEVDESIDLDPDQCQYVIPETGEQCGNSPVEHSDYCWLESHEEPDDDDIDDDVIEENDEPLDPTASTTILLCSGCRDGIDDLGSDLPLTTRAA